MMGEGELQKRIKAVTYREYVSLPGAEPEEVLAIVKEAKKELKIPKMPFIPPFVIEESNIPNAKELSEWLRKVHELKLNLEKWFGK